MSRDSAKGPGRVGSLGEVRHESGDPPGGLARVGGPSGRSETGRGTLEEVRDGLGDPRGSQGWNVDLAGGPVWVRGPLGGPGQVGGPSWRFGTGRGTLGEVLDGSEAPREGSRRVGRAKGRYETVRGIHGEVGDKSENPPGGPGQVGGSFRDPGRVR